MELLALDFDGVISDSAPEAFVVAVRTYAALRPGSSWAGELQRALERGACERSEVTALPSFREFLERMPLGNRAEDYGVVLSSMESSEELPDQAAYDRWRDRQPEKFSQAYHQRFYELRREYAARDPEGWAQLMGPYSEFVALLRKWSGAVQLAIATAKDRESVQRLLLRYEIADLFPERRVLDKEAGVSKCAHLSQLRDSLGVAWSEMTFVDDKLNHLDAVAPLGVRCALAAWGYNGDRERALARRRGYLVCDLSDAERLLFGAVAEARERAI